MKYPSKAKLEALDQAIAETLALAVRLRAVADQIHAGQPVSAAMRDVMASLEESGPRTVPRLARMRPVSRQNVQTLVNQLVTKALVRLEANPAHRRSRLVALTSDGKQALDEMTGRERRLLSQAPVGVGKKDLRNAAATLRSVRKLFESEHWSSLIRG